MSKKKKKQPKDRFADLSWDDLNVWAGSRIVSRGKNYQGQNLVSDLAKTSKGGLIAWVNGTRRYATKVVMEDGLPSSICTCPYEYECKHGVATVLEYLEQVKNKKRVPSIQDDDERLGLLDEEAWERDDWDDDVEDEDDENGVSDQELSAFLQRKTKKQLIEVILAMAVQHPDIGQDLLDQKQVTSGDAESLVARLQREIHDFGREPDWQSDYESTDYLMMGDKLNMLLKAGHADDVLSLGKELMAAGLSQIELGHHDLDMDWEDCAPVLLSALGQSSLDAADRLAWVVDVLLDDDYSLFDDLGDYLNRKHAKNAWSRLADQLWARLKTMKFKQNDDDFHRKYARDRLCNWVIHALEKAGRQEEIIPLCETEARKTQSYVRLVKRLIAAKRYQEGKQWIQEGLGAIKGKWAGVASELRDALRMIHAKQKDWKTLAALQVEAFVLHPSTQAFTDCKKAANKIKMWDKVRQTLLTYLEKGKLPWKQKGWTLGASGLNAPEAAQSNRFPMLGDLIDIAILEKKPDQVLHWYDRLPKNRFWGVSVNEDKIAVAIQTHAPDRAVSIWQHMAEALIAQTKPRAYEEAGRYLRKAGAVMAKQRKKTKWSEYLRALRQTHARKRRFLEVLDGLSNEPIVKKKR